MIKKRNTEVDAYVFIKNNLSDMGWIVKNPLRNDAGQVYTQNECLGNDRIQEQLGSERPENIVKLSETQYYVIEAKRERNQIDQAVQEAEYYAKKINKSEHITTFIISGIAGNDTDGYVIQSKFLINKKFNLVTLNKKKLTSLISPDIAKILLSNKTSDISEIPLNEKLFLDTAEKINIILHNGSISADRRGKVMSALLLSMIGDTLPNLNASTVVLIDEINARANAILQEEGKPEFYDYVRIVKPSTSDNHVKIKQALVKTIQELSNLNIVGAMESGTDYLGKFYEVFLKYGNWAKELGIVFTPRHITKFATDVLDVKGTDIIYDPTCGTGGFLVSAFDHVKKNHPQLIDNFKQHNLFGLEYESSIAALAIVNMIFRGDGKNNIKEADCFKTWLNLKRIRDNNTAEYVKSKSKAPNPPINKVLMNPPFALKEKDEKEFKFIEHALSQMQNKGLLFAVLPTSQMLARGQYRKWRKDMLESNTLIAVITFPPSLFYPIGTHTCAIIVKKGIPHNYEQNVLWLRAIHDGFVIRKGKRLSPKTPLNEPDYLTDYTNMVKDFVKDQNIKIPNIPELIKATPINKKDKSLELVTEFYLDEKKPSQKKIYEGIEQMVRRSTGYLLSTMSRKQITLSNNIFNQKPYKIKTFNLVDVCDVERKYAPYINEILSDQKITPYVTTTEDNNGISTFCDTESNFKKNSITVALDGTCGTTFYQFEDYIAGEKTAVLTLKEKFDSCLLFYIGYLVWSKSWRYHYGRKLSETRLKQFKIDLPIDKNDKIDYDYIDNLVKSCYGWEIILNSISE